MKRFLLVIGGMAIGILAAYAITYLTGCGPSPWAPCSAVQANEQRCGGTAIQMCDGEHWQPVVDCSRRHDADGVLITGVCVDEEGGPQCR